MCHTCRYYSVEQEARRLRQEQDEEIRKRLEEEERYLREK